MQLLDLVDLDLLLRLQDKFSSLLGFNVVFTGLDCQPVGSTGRPTVPGSICHLMVGRSDGKDRCEKSDNEAGDIAKMRITPVLYRCQCYFSNFVIPITVSNQVIGFVYGGQFFVRRPSDRTPSQWKIEQAMRSLSNDDAPAMKEDIQAQEDAEWVALKEEIRAYECHENGKHIHAEFFHNGGKKPEQEDLEGIGHKCGLTNKEIAGFIRDHQKQSNPDLPGNRVKKASDVFHAIRTLSEIANALSEECNIKYALKVHFDATQQMSRSDLLKVSKEAAADYRGLSEEVALLLKHLKTEERLSDRIAAIEHIADKSDTILKTVKQKELKKLARESLADRWLYLNALRRKKTGQK